MFLQSYLPCEERFVLSVLKENIYIMYVQLMVFNDLYSAAAVASKTYFLVQDRRVNICLFCFLG